MDVLDSICVSSDCDGQARKYYYRLTNTLFNNKNTYGLEVEKQDFIEDQLNKIERESLPIISTERNKVQAMFELLYKNVVSPIHVIDILGEEIDECAYYFA